MSPVIPTMRYRDAPAMIEWLCAAFAFERHLVVPDESGGIAHAQLAYRGGMIMLGSQRADEFGKTMAMPDEIGGRETRSVYVVVPDADAHHARAVAAGAVVTMAPRDEDHGGRAYGCADPEGHRWYFGSYDPWT